MDKSNLLIDFSSPTQKNELKPLIPVPPQTTLVSEEIQGASVDPFEVQDTEASDPFDCIEQRAFNNLSGKPQLSHNSHSEKSPIVTVSSSDVSKNTLKIENSDKQSNPSYCSLDDIEGVVNPLECNKTFSGNKIPKHSNVKVELSNSTHPQSSNIAQDELKSPSKSSVIMESDNQSRISADFSTEESLKAVIAKRVNRCIQDVLNGSLKTNKNVDKSFLTKPQNRRSLSFIGLSTGQDKKECDRLNKSCTDMNDTVNFENQQLHASSDSSGFGLVSLNSTDLSAEGNVEDQVFKEARKLSRTFSKLAGSFRQDPESDSDDEDLLSCKPRWLYTESSEDEEEKLLKDPALNLRWRSDSSAYSSPAPQPHKGSDSPALLAFRSRRSFTNVHTALNNTQEELKLRRSISVGSQLKEVPAIPSTATLVPINLMNTDAQPIKLKKNNPGDMKKGPLRAVMPIQSMTKEPLPIVGKLSSKPDSSPEARVQRSAYIMGTPNKENSQLNITPMASSTPNKSESFSSNVGNGSILLKPVASVAANKRHSLEGSFRSHKSRGVVAEGGARPRSNSANSSIPRVMQVKPVRGLPLAPRSFSNLPHAANTQINANTAKSVTTKKTTSHPKSSVNSRILTDVKTKSPRQSKVRTAVSTLSNLVRGKKTASRDKENRVPA